MLNKNLRLQNMSRQRSLSTRMYFVHQIDKILIVVFQFNFPIILLTYYKFLFSYLIESIANWV